MDRTALPIGTIVQVEGNSEPFMIVNHCPVTEKAGKQGYFDFGAVPLPIGLSSQEFLSQYDEMVAGISYPKFTVEEFKA